jgi:hypothetical protein
MIYYICHAAHVYTLGIFLSCYRNDIRDRVRIISYDDLFCLGDLRAGVFIFTDFDRLSDDDLVKATQIADHLQSILPGVVVLNHPGRCLGRFALLSALHASDPFYPQVTRLKDWQNVTTFPVFIRAERDHLQALSGLIAAPAELAVKAARLLNSAAAPEDLIVIQFKNAQNGAGYFEKYGAFRVGDAIYGQHLLQSEGWWVKDSSSVWDTTRIEQTLAYTKNNPHADLLMPIFVLAGTEYGRIDYCVVDGRIVVFEINTNPVVNANAPSPFMSFDAQFYADLHNAAMLALPTISGAGVTLLIGPRLKAKTITADTAHRTSLVTVRRKVRRRRIRQTLRELRTMFRRDVAR